jgi:hypothetical protein
VRVVSRDAMNHKRMGTEDEVGDGTSEAGLLLCPGRKCMSTSVITELWNLMNCWRPFCADAAVVSESDTPGLTR